MVQDFGYPRIAPVHRSLPSASVCSERTHPNPKALYAHQNENTPPGPGNSRPYDLGVFFGTRMEQRPCGAPSSPITVKFIQQMTSKLLPKKKNSTPSSKLSRRLHGMSWGVKTTCFKAPRVSLGSGVSIGGVRILSLKMIFLFPGWDMSSFPARYIPPWCPDHNGKNGVFATLFFSLPRLFPLDVEGEMGTNLPGAPG